MNIHLKNNFSSFLTLHFTFIELWTILSALKLLSAGKIEFQVLRHQFFDLAN